MANRRIAYSIAEAAEQLSISVANVHALIAAGQLGSVKLGRRRLVPHEAIVALLEGLDA